MAKVKYKKVSSELLKMATLSENEGEETRSSVNSYIEATEHYLISIDKLIPYHRQARHYFDTQEIENLAKSISDHGIRQPLTVIQSSVEDKKYEVVSGERRLKAAKLVGLKKIPCIIISDSILAEEIALIENIQRQDLHPIELGEALLKILDNRKGMTQLELSERLGMSNRVVSEVIQYARLPEEVKHKAISQKIVGRDYLRKMVKSKDPFDLISKDSVAEKGIKSILRVNFNDGDFRIQLSSLIFLNEDQKLQLKTMLMEVVNNIC